MTLTQKYLFWSIYQQLHLRGNGIETTFRLWRTKTKDNIIILRAFHCMLCIYVQVSTTKLIPNSFWLLVLNYFLSETHLYVNILCLNIFKPDFVPFQLNFAFLTVNKDDMYYFLLMHSMFCFFYLFFQYMKN